MLDSERFEIQSCFSVPLSSMDAEEPADHCGPGILIPRSEIGRQRIGVTRQFLDDASDYHEKYTDSAYFGSLLRSAFARIGFANSSPVILDIGSGSGNSVFPCLEIFDDPRIVATDISPDLLRILAHHVGKLGCQEQVVPVCMDATRDLYAENRFDLVVGAAILHHLITPEDAIIAGLKALKPGGRAIFFEPFEAGNAILRIAYRDILERSSREASGSERALRVLEAVVRDIEVRSIRDKSDEIFTRIDDKWLFTRRYFEDISRRLGLHCLDIYPLHGTDEPFSNQTRTNLRLAAGLEPDALGDWAWEILASYDSAFSDDLKLDLMIEGAVILTK